MIEIFKKYLEENPEKNYSEIANEILEKECLGFSHRTLRKKLSETDKQDSAPIQTKRQAIEKFNISDEILGVEYTSWDVTNSKGEKFTNNRVAVKTKPKVENFDYKKATELALNHITEPVSNKKTKGFGKVVLAISDIHVGAKTGKDKGVVITPEFNIDVIIARLIEVANHCNSLEKESVCVAIAGDLLESLTGLNHLNSWQEMEENQHGANVIISTYKILSFFLSRINNLEKVYMVSGNHDRYTASKEMDHKGDSAKLVAFMLEQHYRVEYHPLILSWVYDDISYIMTHGDNKLINTIETMILNYGVQGKYNVVLSGHLHTRKVKKPTDFVLKDSLHYRGIILPPIFTGNYYSERSGYTSSPGAVCIAANARKTNVHCFDYGL